MTIKQLKPLGTYVAIKVQKAKKMSGKIARANTNPNAINEVAQVIAVGEDVTKVKKGQYIAFKAFDLQDVEVDGEKYPYILENDIIAVQ